MAGLYVRNGGVWHQAVSPAVHAAGAWKTLQQGWVRNGGTWHQFYSGFWNAQLTAGTGSGFVGYNQGNWGSLSNATDKNGNTIQSLYDDGSASTTFVITHAGNLTQSYFTTLNINGTLFTSATASFSFSTPNNIWTWSTNYGFVNTNVYPVSLS